MGKRGSLTDFKNGVQVGGTPLHEWYFNTIVLIIILIVVAGQPRTRLAPSAMHAVPFVVLQVMSGLELPPLHPQAVRDHGIPVVTIPRGGETTYHGPGQLVAYPILSLRGLSLGARAYVETLEDTIIAVAGAYGVAARGRVPGRTGVWVGERKLGAVGVRISYGTTSHGLALNVDTDLSAFDAIVPCGAPDKTVTSLAAQVGAKAPLGLTAPGALLTDALARKIRSGGVERLPHLAALVPSLAEFDKQMHPVVQRR